jgi:hypothetical protein
MAGKSERLPGGPFHKGTNPIREGSTLMAESLPLSLKVTTVNSLCQLLETLHANKDREATQDSGLEHKLPDPELLAI